MTTLRTRAAETVRDARDGLAARLAEATARVRRARAWRRRYLTALDELSCYKDRELAELGFTRADLPRVARETADQA